MSDINQKYAKQYATSKNDLFEERKMKNILFQKISSIIIVDQSHPKVITENIIISELTMNLRRYDLIIDKLENLKIVDAHTIVKFSNQVSAATQKLIPTGNFESMQNIITDFNEIHKSLNKIVQAI